MRRLGWGTLLLAAFLAAGCGSSGSRIDRVRGYLDAHNRGDVDGALAFLSEDAFFDVPGQMRFQGRGPIRNLEEWDAALNGRLTLSGFTVRGDTVIAASASEFNDLFDRLGVGEIDYAPGVRFVVKKGLITRVFPSIPDSASQARIRKAFAGFLTWGMPRHPQEIRGLLPGGKFAYSKANAAKWIELVREWKSAPAGSTAAR
jgi:ketosteroid isomerase-like protein